MICKVCLGKGWILNKNYTERIECPACHGTKETEPTEEDWFCSLSTEEKAKVFIAICKDAFRAENYRRNHWVDLQTIEFWTRWLKQPHKEED